MARLATMSRASMRLARATSCGAVSSAHAADLREVGAHRVARLVGGAQVEIGGGRHGARPGRRGRAGRPRRFDDVDAEVGEHHEQVVGLVAAELRVAHHGGDLRRLKVVLLATLRDEADDLVAERLGTFDLLLVGVAHERRDTPNRLRRPKRNGGRAGLG